METLVTLESFIRSAQSSSFSAAARTLGLTPAAVSQNVARLETNLGVRLFQRSTRGLTLTEPGQRLLREASSGLDVLQTAIANVAMTAGQPAGMLKVSMSPAFGQNFVLPLLGDFFTRYPGIVPDWHFDNRPVDIINEGFDAAIGGGFELPTGLAARELARAHIIAVAAPSYVAKIKPPRKPADLKDFDGILMRSPHNGRIRTWPLRNRAGEQVAVEMRPRMLLNDPEACTNCAVMGLGITFTATLNALPHLQAGRLVRLLPDWYADIGPISIYYAGHKQLPAKTRVFVDFIIDSFKRQGLAKQLSAS
ncbi:DNA-binding transcriptional LysR family regulator [Archangium gephyra]|uniref:DNA-binding transcriptional LysR family regulator n=1 Tax=Archangium gephyra TaxID=48 RepID=A0AAC8QBE4_9BACT|nr:LysR family transcriptional regulator [Archangium gephyra]AKJ04627.1 Transcriptional regulator, LysR family [Archangium gephyra]REG37313.1 DNA-binding transcriptional LysR family regulator [Archangium gephyra]